MKYQVHITEDADQDLRGIYRYIARNDSKSKAKKLFGKIEETCLSLSSLPKRGHIPPELEKVAVFDYLEIHFKPYRIIYEISSNKVYIHCILDGRRELNQLLQKRLLR
ncbi:MAG: type II toxin-antitoxin system RelE/ParE family toxin [Candidatus Dadabacteria bacterium]|nr:type II toxin-antitoxin system RelE/ParE family toxin [Candidatus Dadabacteria bacterium]